jgi:hypothetical protein
MLLDDTKTVRVSKNAHESLTEMAQKNHVSVAFIVDFMLGKCREKLEELFAQQPKA